MKQSYFALFHSTHELRVFVSVVNSYLSSPSYYLICFTVAYTWKPEQVLIANTKLNYTDQVLALMYIQVKFLAADIQKAFCKPISHIKVCHYCSIALYGSYPRVMNLAYLDIFYQKQYLLPLWLLFIVHKESSLICVSFWFDRYIRSWVWICFW